MANTKSAKKAIDSSLAKRKVNDMHRKRYKQARKEVRDALKNGEKEKAVKLVPIAMKYIDKAAKKNVIHKNTASRYKSRLAKEINKN